MTNVAQLAASAVDTDATMAANSDAKVPSQKAVKSAIAAAAGSSSGGAALAPTAVKTANYTLVANDFVPVDASGGAFALLLPNAPADKSQCGVVYISSTNGGNPSGTNAVTVSTQGSDVLLKAGGSTSTTLSRTGETIIFQYNAAAKIWYEPLPDFSQLNPTFLNYITVGSYNGTTPNWMIGTSMPWDSSGNFAIESLWNGGGKSLEIENTATTGSVYIKGGLYGGICVGIGTESPHTAFSLDVATGGGSTGIVNDLFGNNPQTGNYTFVTDDNKHTVYHASGGACTWTVPANASVGFRVGSIVHLFNDSTGGGTVTVNITSDTLIQDGGVGVITSFTLAVSHGATLEKVASTRWRVTLN